MNESIAEKSRHQEQKQPIELIDCGRASKTTQGLPLMLHFELAWPPNNKRLPF